MAEINITVTLKQTQITLDAQTIQNIFTWIKNNIKDKLPTGTAVIIQYTLTD